jgi:serine protease Do
VNETSTRHWSFGPWLAGMIVAAALGASPVWAQSDGPVVDDGKQAAKPAAEAPSASGIATSPQTAVPDATVTPAAAMKSATVPTPASMADLAGALLPAVVNISSVSTVKPDAKGAARPERERDDQDVEPRDRDDQDQGQGDKPASPFEQFFKDFLEHQGHGGQLPPGHEQLRKAVSLGSGFIIDPSGLVVTNNHVIDGADEITVILQDDTKLKAELLGHDPRTDLALLQVKTKRKLTAVHFGESDLERAGDWVVAIGNPFGLGGTVTLGIVSARSRAIGNDDGIYDDFIQTDASINRGNSGGPLFNLKGEVIGINTAIFSPSGGSIGIGFSIPSDLANTIVGQLKAYGKPRRGYLGARIESVNGEVAEGLGLEQPKGVLVAGLIDKSPAQQAGLQPGDVILSVDGREVPDARRFERMVVDQPVDHMAKLKLMRKRQEKVIEVKIGELEESDETQVASLGREPRGPAPAIAKVLGLGVALATPELKEKYQLNDAAQIVVTEVAKGSPAGERDLKPGDVIIEVAQQEIKTPEDLPKRVEEAKKAGRKSILLLVERGGDLHFVALRIDRG